MQAYQLAFCEADPGGMLQTSLKLSSLRRTSLRFTSRASGPIAIVAILLVGGVATHRSVSRDPQPVSETRALILSLLGSTRPFEGRLFGMEYRPFDPEKEWRPEPRAPVRIAKELRQKARAGEEKVLAEIALVEALGGDLDQGIRLLDEAARQEGAEKWIWSDLAVLYLARYRQKGDSEDLLKALDASSRAPEGEGSIPEAVFNQGLVLEEIFLFDQAQSAWERSRLDQDVQWVAEAQDHLDELNRLDPGKDRENRLAVFSRAPQAEIEMRAAELVRDFPQAAREHAQSELLSRWAADQQAGRKEMAARHLEETRTIAHQLSARGEHMALDAIVAIDRVAARDAKEELDTLALQHTLYFKGASDAREGSCERALPLLREARRGLEERSSPLSRWASMKAAICEYRQFRYDDAQRTLGTLVETVDRDRYPALLGATRRMLGLIQGIKGDPVASLAEYRLAADAYERIGERENRAALDVLVAEISRILGDQDSAWKSLWKAIQELPRVEEPRNRYSALSEAAVLAEEMDLPGAALRFMDASLQVTGEDAEARAACLRRRAELCSRIGLLDAARDSLEEARGMLSAIRDVEGRLALDGDLLAVESEILSVEEPTRALGKLTRAIEVHETTSYRKPLSQLLAQRARLQRKLGRADLARNDIRRAGALVEEQRRKLSKEDLGPFVVQSRAVHDEMARIHMLLGQTEQAFLATERGRDFFFLAPLPQGIEWLQREIPEDTALVEYAFLERKLHAWVIRAEQIASVDLAAGERTVSHSVERLRRIVESKGSPAELREVTGGLYDQIIRPLESSLAGTNRLVFVPDGVLYQVPFAGLWDRMEKRFLLQDFTIVMSPSAALHAAATQRKRTLWKDELSSVLVVGNPLVDQRAWPALTDLPEAGREASRISRLYPKATVLSGAEATPEVFLSHATQSEVIHVAAHALTNSAYPALSALVLSPSRGGSGALYVRELSRGSYPRTRLVVLAACSSLGEWSFKRSGTLGLAQPFLAQGVPTVIGTLWSVGDSGANEIVQETYGFLREGFEPASALRLAQLKAMERQSEAAISWMAFQAAGS